MRAKAKDFSMKLIVQIPCYNEEATLRATVADIPRQIDGVDEVEILVIDDGSVDGTARVAREAGVEHVIRHKINKGLAQAFRSGIDAALAAGADVIVNTDGDNQYAGRSIPDLVRPILEGRADIVIGDRRPSENPEFSWTKRRLQALGSLVVRRLSGTNVPDAVSGFRAISRQAALALNIVSPFSYTIETLIQAGSQQMAVESVPVETNAARRPSRLFRNIPHFLVNSATTVVRIYAMYHPLRTFGYLGILLGVIGLVPILRFLYLYAVSQAGGHVQSLVLGGVAVLMGFLCLLFALLADLVNFNRKLIEETQHKVRRMELEGGRWATTVGDSAAREITGNASESTSHRDKIAIN